MNRVPYRVWLRAVMDARQLTVTDLARAVAAEHIARGIATGHGPAALKTCDPEVIRRQLHRYLSGEHAPDEPMRATIRDALRIARNTNPQLRGKAAA